MTARLPTSPTVLVARARGRAAGLIQRLREAGIEAVAAPVIERAPVDDPAGVAELAGTRAALSRGEYAWVAVTSVNAVDALLGTDESGARQLVELSPARTAESSTDHRDRPGRLRARWACVGPATRRAIEAHGLTVDLMPADHMTAAGLVHAFPEAPAAASPVAPGRDHDVAVGGRAPTGRDVVVDDVRGRRVLVPLGDLAGSTLPDGLRGKGWEPHVVTAYRTVARELPPDVVDHATGRGYDAVVIASGSAARQVAAQIGPQRVVAIGEPSASAAREAGHDVATVAAGPTDAALATAVVHAFELSA